MPLCPCPLRVQVLRLRCRCSLYSRNYAQLHSIATAWEAGGEPARHLVRHFNLPRLCVYVYVGVGGGVIHASVRECVCGGGGHMQRIWPSMSLCVYAMYSCA